MSLTSRLRRTAAIAAAALAISSGAAAGLVAGATPALAATSWTAGVCKVADTTKVTVVVDVQNLNNPLTTPVVRCVSGLTSSSTGLAALQAAGVNPVGTAQYGLAFICRLLNRPSSTETFTVSGKPYTESCGRTPPAAAYWGYWQATNGGAWTYSNYGASTAKVKLGGFEGWSFSLNRTASTNPAPRFTAKRVG